MTIRMSRDKHARARCGEILDRRPGYFYRPLRWLWLRVAVASSERFAKQLAGEDVFRQPRRATSWCVRSLDFRKGSSVKIDLGEMLPLDMSIVEAAPCQEIFIGSTRRRDPGPPTTRALAEAMARWQEQPETKPTG